MTSGQRGRVAFAALAVVALAAVGVAFAVFSGRTGVDARAPARHGDAAAAPLAIPALPTSPAPAFSPRRPVLLEHPTSSARWAPVLRPVVAHAEPSVDSATVATLSTTTPEGTTNIVLVLRNELAGGTLWTLVRLPVLPNGTVGWVPRSALGGYVFVETHLVVDRANLLATLYRDGRAVFRAPIGIGTPDAPTPAGEFFIRDKLTKFRSPFYGPVAFGTSARSPVLTDWPGGGFVGVHGTNEPQLLPGRVSHGCIRLRNEDILRLAHLLPVGTPVTIR
jgi:hypothetical protein